MSIEYPSKVCTRHRKKVKVPSNWTKNMQWKAQKNQEPIFYHISFYDHTCLSNAKLMAKNLVSLWEFPKIIKGLDFYFWSPVPCKHLAMLGLRYFLIVSSLNFLALFGIKHFNKDDNIHYKLCTENHDIDKRTMWVIVQILSFVEGLHFLMHDWQTDNTFLKFKLCVLCV